MVPQSLLGLLALNIAVVAAGTLYRGPYPPPHRPYKPPYKPLPYPLVYKPPYKPPYKPAYAPPYKPPPYKHLPYKPVYKSAPPPYEGYTHGPASYAFGYAVSDHYTGTNFGHEEQRDGYATKGSYKVALPDGRTQIVSYVADDYGYNADVAYEGEAYHHPQYPAKPGYPVPAYKPAYKPAYVPPYKPVHGYAPAYA